MQNNNDRRSLTSPSRKEMNQELKTEQALTNLNQSLLTPKPPAAPRPYQRKRIMYSPQK